MESSPLVITQESPIRDRRLAGRKSSEGRRNGEGAEVGRGGQKGWNLKFPLLISFRFLVISQASVSHYVKLTY